MAFFECETKINLDDCMFVFYENYRPEYKNGIGIYLDSKCIGNITYCVVSGEFSKEWVLNCVKEHLEVIDLLDEESVQ